MNEPFLCIEHFYGLDSASSWYHTLGITTSWKYPRCCITISVIKMYGYILDTMDMNQIGEHITSEQKEDSYNDNDIPRINNLECL
jgi:hypothetical protein